MQLSMNNLKGGINHACRMVDRVLPIDDACELDCYIVDNIPQYNVADIPVDSNQYLVRCHFHAGVSFTEQGGH